MSQIAPSIFTYRETEIEVWSGVFAPNRTTELLLDAALKTDFTGKTILDLGCGCGVVGLMTRKFSKAKAIYGSDISQRAVDNATGNAKRLGLDLEFKTGSLFEPWQGRKFDVIIDDVAAVADPIARISPWYPPEVVCEAGRDGTVNTIKMLQAAQDYLAPGGIIFLPTVSLSDEGKILSVARSLYRKVEPILQKSWPFKEDFWQRIAASAECKRLIDEGVVKVAQRGSRFLWDTNIHMVTLA